MTAYLVIETSDANLIAAYVARRVEVVDWSARLADWAYRTVGSTKVWYHFFLDRISPNGLFVPDTMGQLPVGWARHRTQTERIIPKMTTAQGRAAAAQLAAFGDRPNLRAVLKGIPFAAEERPEDLGGTGLPVLSEENALLPAKFYDEVTFGRLRLVWTVPVMPGLIDQTIWSDITEEWKREHPDS